MQGRGVRRLGRMGRKRGATCGEPGAYNELMAMKLGGHYLDRLVIGHGDDEEIFVAVPSIFTCGLYNLSRHLAPSSRPFVLTTTPLINLLPASNQSVSRLFYSLSPSTSLSPSPFPPFFP